MKTRFVETLSRSASTLHIVPQLLAVVKTFSKPSLKILREATLVFISFLC